MKKRIILCVAAALLVVTAALAGTFRRYRIATASDAPTLLPGDLVVVSVSAYDLTVPFSWTQLVRIADPQRGDMVICRLPGITPCPVYVKRVVGLPGDEIEVRGHQLHVNGEPVELRELNRALYRELDERGQLGQVVALESGLGGEHLVSYSPSASPGHGPVRVGPGQYFLLGDNRDNSLDSRQLGTISRGRILGKVVGSLTRRR